MKTHQIVGLSFFVIYQINMIIMTFIVTPKHVGDYEVLYRVQNDILFVMLLVSVVMCLPFVLKSIHEALVEIEKKKQARISK